jgi:hypothetical protein
MKTDLDKLIGSLEKAHGQKRLQASASVAIPLAEVLGLGAALQELLAVLSPAASAAIVGRAATVPMTPSDLQQLRLAQTLAANANLSTFDPPAGWANWGLAAEAPEAVLTQEYADTVIAKYAASMSARMTMSESFAEQDKMLPGMAEFDPLKPPKGPKGRARAAIRKWAQDALGTARERATECSETWRLHASKLGPEDKLVVAELGSRWRQVNDDLFILLSAPEGAVETAASQAGVSIRALRASAQSLKGGQWGQGMQGLLDNTLRDLDVIAKAFPEEARAFLFTVP